MPSKPMLVLPFEICLELASGILNSDYKRMLDTHFSFPLCVLLVCTKTLSKPDDFTWF